MNKINAIQETVSKISTTEDKNIVKYWVKWQVFASTKILFDQKKVTKLVKNASRNHIF